MVLVCIETSHEKKENWWGRKKNNDVQITKRDKAYSTLVNCWLKAGFSEKSCQYLKQELVAGALQG